MEFNTLDAQRESCESYITSQKTEGWMAVVDRYDDGGFSGGNLERPGLKRLLADIEGDRIDCVVVYKIDRLTRSLMDFSKLVESFERNNVTFVSVTQHFNTTSSMGRLTLNILLSFSQFERELSAERIRDKIAASRRRGIWMGGHPPLGYDVRDRKLIINETEAELVRHIFKRYIQIGSSSNLARELAEQGCMTKSWTSKTGRVREGKLIDRGVLFRILNNRVYIGDVVHKENIYPGEQDAIIDRTDWERVQTILATNTHRRANRSRAQTAAPLKSILRCGSCGRAMAPSHTRKGGRLYRYYICQNAINNGYDACPLKTVAAREIEGIVLGQLHALVQTPEMVINTWRAAKTDEDGITERDVVQALQTIDPVWESLFPGEQHRLVQLLVGRVTVNTNDIELRLRGEGIDTLIRDLINNDKEKAV